MAVQPKFLRATTNCVLRCVLGAAAVLALYVPAAHAETATTGPLASVTSISRISALSGWLVWSAQQPDGSFALQALHDGVTRTVPVRSSATPFDMDLGTDASGRVVAVFPRCKTMPNLRPDGTLPVPGGCVIRVVDLLSGKERSAGIPRSTADSDTDASMWQGQLAVARHDPAHKDVEQLLLWSPQSRKLTALPHGAVPTKCPYAHSSVCKKMRVSGTASGLDLGSKLVAFVWAIQAPSVIGYGGDEVRAVSLKSHRSSLVGEGYAGEECTGGVNGALPSPPNVVGTSVWYAEVTDNCYQFNSLLIIYSIGPVAGRWGPLAGTVLQLVKDGPKLYALIAPPNADETDYSCSRPGAPCTIQQLAAMPPLTAVPHDQLPTSPFF